jgi:hypothetical protein
MQSANALTLTSTAVDFIAVHAGKCIDAMEQHYLEGEDIWEGASGVFIFRGTQNRFMKISRACGVREFRLGHMQAASVRAMHLHYLE